MYNFVTFFERNAGDLLFNVVAITVFYIIARMLGARPGVSLGFAFVPMFLAWAWQGATLRMVLERMF